MPELKWLKSSFSTGANNECVEAAALPCRLIHLRESDDPAVVISVSSTTLAALLRTLKAGSGRVGGPRWRKSSFSGGGNGECLEAAYAPGGRLRLRESDDPGVVIAVHPTALAALLRTVKAGGAHGAP
ncbi:DUF397 domain-containing protein [Streptomyces sp. NPDC049585]|uniref:DUF397 domain-containing protein n=1 Tax=Streptomyces sp. NPDC049585 TaxID=3155154 RepID=UPI003432929D